MNGYANFRIALVARRLRQYELAGELRISPSLLSEMIAGRKDIAPELRARIAAWTRAGSLRA